ncbi:zonular occludens toxin [Vibrio vulnificus]|nr:zonular occludens toxin [Vibrio vulnificus]
MMYLRTGLPGASKSLNSLRELVLSYNPDRPYYYTNIKLLMLDIEVACSFSGWFYGWYFPRITDKRLKRKLIKIMKPVHNNDEFCTAKHLPWLAPQYEAHNHFETWLYWVKKVYPSSSLVALDNILDAVDQACSVDMFELVKPLNLHFTHFEDPNFWYDLPKGSVLLIDECQEYWPPRQVGSKVPHALAKMEKHRHGGYDLHFVTQDPTFCDQHIRKLVGRHIHYFNPFGGKRIVRYENPQTFDPRNYHDKKQAQKKPSAHPVNFYGCYWSAEIHTHKFKFPKFALVGLLTLAFVFFGLYFVYSLIANKAGWNDEPPQVEHVEDSNFQDLQNVPVTTPVSSLSRTSINTTNPLTKTYSVAPAAEITPIQVQLTSYLDELLQDVYISGSVYVNQQGVDFYDYAFYRTSDSAVFDPYAVALVVEPISACLANVRLQNLTRLVTCNPFYVRVPVDDDDDDDRENGNFFPTGGDASRNDEKKENFL